MRTDSADDDGGFRLMSLFRAFSVPAIAAALLLSNMSGIALAGNEPSSITAYRKTIVPMLGD